LAIIKELEQSEAHVHTCIHVMQVCYVQCEFMYEDSGVRVINYMLFKVQIFEVGT